jgi:hypothetical protein
MWNKKNFEKQLDIDEVIQLSHIDAIRDILAFKLEEIKAGDVGKLIDDYREKKEHYRRMLYEEAMGEEAANNVNKKDSRLFTAHGEEPDLYWFVLTRYREWKWQITESVPELRSHEGRSRVLPDDIIRRMEEDSKKDPVTLYSPDPVYSSDSSSFYDLRYVRFSSNTIFGTVRKNRPPSTSEKTSF